MTGQIAMPDRRISVQEKISDPEERDVWIKAATLMKSVLECFISTLHPGP